MFDPTRESFELMKEISKTVETWHCNHHFLLDIAEQEYKRKPVHYVEIGCYNGASSCLMLQRPNTKVVAIDLGMIPEEIVTKNIDSHIKEHAEFTYLIGNSQDQKTIKAVINKLRKIDILFIDGSHLTEDVIKDFNAYEKYVRVGGFVVFDDYKDIAYGVGLAVTYLFRDNDKYKCIGSISNKFDPAGDEYGNCFVARKLK